MKKCCKCKKYLPLTSFGNNKTKKDGKQTACYDCKRIYSKNRYKNNREKHLSQTRDWAKRNPEKRKEISNRHRQNNRDKARQKQKDYANRNPLKIKQRWQSFYKNNKDYCRSRSAARRASKIRATPPWLTKEHKSQIKSFYLLARDCELTSGEKYHVDHIIPLKGENICGLHVPWNLQVLPADINISKKNYYDYL